MVAIEILFVVVVVIVNRRQALFRPGLDYDYDNRSAQASLTTISFRILPWHEFEDASQIACKTSGGQAE